MDTHERYGIPAGYGREILFQGRTIPNSLVFEVAPNQFLIKRKPVDKDTFRREFRKATAGSPGRQLVEV
jgi:hypothetical protein